MAHRIDEDWKDFKDTYSGKKRKKLQDLIRNGQIFRRRGKDGKVIVTIPRIDIPIIIRGPKNSGIGRGEGEEGQIIEKGKKGKGKGGNKAGQESGDGVDISVDLDEVLKLMQEDLELPDLKPKPNQTYEEIEIRYNDISLTGPESLRHNRRTLKQAMKRQCSDGSIFDLYNIPGYPNPTPLIVPINSDRRYRQYKEIKIPASNAVIFFARDGSISMNQEKCDIVSDISWWIDLWIRKFYERIERCYIWHDTVASEVDESKFYKHRYGGGTTCSSAMKLIAKQLENRFPPEKWNIYIFYFTDGENWPTDNDKFAKTIKDNFDPKVVNLIGLTQVLSYRYENSLKQFVDNGIGKELPNLRTTAISHKGRRSYGAKMDEDEKSDQIRNAIIDLIGKQEA